MMTRTAGKRLDGRRRAAVSSYRGGPDGGRDAGLVPSLGECHRHRRPVRVRRRPTQLPDGQARPYFTESWRRGTPPLIRRDHNRGSRPWPGGQRSTGITAVNSGSSYYGSFKPCVGTGCWVSGLRRPSPWPGETTVMPFTVTVPPDRPGSTLPGSRPSRRWPTAVIVGSNGRSTAQAVIVDEVSVGVAVNVGDPSQFASNLRIDTITRSGRDAAPPLRPHPQWRPDVLKSTGQ